ncbi:hypothetical protein [Pelomicrobium methylotrophicum]|uniref:Uncharacterized protein n=1 Tax=Pelomicrobium methylotrophicum TaxID=2602750 RepID=A0A5C7EET5_9PROT|nr:hypothetical protein [Pelomicrobium methylotrophicum]TXF10356.1 hypothetical protein FR698_15650 [Pelomicrobium methylotrophicum]
MQEFNAGRPRWEDYKLLFAAIVYESARSKGARALGIGRDEIEKAVMAAFVESASDIENWNAGIAAMEGLVAARLSSGDEAAGKIKSIVREFAAHFTGKLTNSHATTGGVVARPDPDPLPFLYAGAFGYKVPLDYIKNAGASSAFIRMRDVYEKSLAGQPLEAHEAMVAKAFKEALKELGSGEDRDVNATVDWRLRQIMLPKDDGYVVLTPLSSGGISKMVADRAYDVDGGQRKRRFLAEKLTLPVGGNNRQNVTAFPEAETAWLFRVPNVSTNGDVIYRRLANSGFSLVETPDLRDAIREYADWYLANRCVPGKDTVLSRRIERAASGIGLIAYYAMEQVMEAMEAVHDYLDGLTAEEKRKARAALEEKGAIEAAIASYEITRDLIEALADLIVKKIDGAKYGKKNADSIVLDMKDKSRLRESIIESLQKQGA